MKHRSLWTALCALGLAACGGSDRASIVPEAPAGAYLVAVGTDQAFSSGYYYVADDGAATLAIEDTASARVTTLYRRDAGGAWQAVPSSGLTLPVKFLERRDDAMAATTLADLSGRYAASTGAGGVVFFAIDAQGRIGALAGSACAVSGRCRRARRTGCCPSTTARAFQRTCVACSSAIARGWRRASACCWKAATARTTGGSTRSEAQSLPRCRLASQRMNA